MKASSSDRYLELQVRHNLPTLKDVQAKFRFDIDPEENAIDTIRMEMSDRIFSITERVLEPLLTGAESFSSMFEQGMVTEKERERVFSLYKKIQVLKWENTLLTIKPDEQKIAKWIKKTWDLWNSDLEKEFTTLCEKFSTNWEKLTIKDTKIDYHG